MDKLAMTAVDNMLEFTLLLTSTEFIIFCSSQQLFEKLEIQRKAAKTQSRQENYSVCADLHATDAQSSDGSSQNSILIPLRLRFLATLR